MNLDFKKAFKDVFNLKYFWAYLFIFTVITSLSTILQSAKGVPYNSLIANILSVVTYVSFGYLYLAVNNLLNDKELNNEDETFFENLWCSTKKGLKCFVGILANTFIGFVCSALFAIICVFIFIKKTGTMITENNLFSYPILIAIFAVLAVLLTIYMLFVLKLLPIAYSENFSLKTMFCWRKVLKRFFKKGNTKNTFKIIGLYFLTVITLFLMLFLVMFLFNLIVVYSIKTLLVNHYLIAAFLLNISAVITPFIAGMLNYIISAVTYHLLGQIYKNKIEE